MNSHYLNGAKVNKVEDLVRGDIIRTARGTIIQISGWIDKDRLMGFDCEFNYEYKIIENKEGWYYWPIYYGKLMIGIV